MALKIKSKVSKIVAGVEVNGENKRYIILADGVNLDPRDQMFGAVLFDTYTNKVFTTKYGRDDDFAERNKSTNIFAVYKTYTYICNEILKNILVDFDFSFDGNINSQLESLSRHYSINNPMGIPVTVIGGRKGKGSKGILLYGKQVDDFVVYGPRTTSMHPVILNTETGEIFKPNSFSYLSVDSNFVKNYNDKVKSSIIERVNKDDGVLVITHLIGLYTSQMCNLSFDKDRFKDILNDYVFEPLRSGFANLNEHNEALLKAYFAKKDKEFAERKKLEMPGIIKWVETHTDKTGDDILKLAERIFNKHNSISYEF